MTLDGWQALSTAVWWALVPGWVLGAPQWLRGFARQVHPLVPVVVLVHHPLLAWDRSLLFKGFSFVMLAVYLVVWHRIDGRYDDDDRWRRRRKKLTDAVRAAAGKLVVVPANS